MHCPKCSSTDTKVVDSRTPSSGGSIRRRRECTQCGHRFSTLEQHLGEDVQVEKRQGNLEPFDKNKLLKSLTLALNKRPYNLEEIRISVQGTQEHLQKEFDNVIPSQAIAGSIMHLLRKIDPVAYVRYASQYKEFKETGGMPAHYTNTPTMT
jgi:transcriptional repressor NrdR